MQKVLSTQAAPCAVAFDGHTNITAANSEIFIIGRIVHGAYEASFRALLQHTFLRGRRSEEGGEGGVSDLVPNRTLGEEGRKKKVLLKRVPAGMHHPETCPCPL